MRSSASRPALPSMSPTLVLSTEKPDIYTGAKGKDRLASSSIQVKAIHEQIRWCTYILQQTILRHSPTPTFVYNCDFQPQRPEEITSCLSSQVLFDLGHDGLLQFRPLARKMPGHPLQQQGLAGEFLQRHGRHFQEILLHPTRPWHYRPCPAEHAETRAGAQAVHHMA